MVAPPDFRASFRDIFVESPTRVLVVAGDDEVEKTDIEATWILRWNGSWGAQPIWIRATSVVAIRHPEVNGLFMGIDGKIARWGAPPIKYEVIDESDDGPQNFGDLREIRCIGTKAFVTGMGRTVYRCDGVDKWIRMDYGIRDEDLEGDDSGFNSIDGHGEDELVAVGWNGEIWEMIGSQWTRVDSPTNLTFNKVLCLPDRKTVACGQHGVLVVNNGFGWRLVEHNVTSDDFWGLAWFKGSIYLSTLNGIYRWDDTGIFKISILSADPEQKIEIQPNISFFRLHTDGNVLWSIGRKMSIYTTDGLRWVEPPYR